MDIPEEYKFIEIPEDCEKCIFNGIDGVGDNCCYLFGYEHEDEYWDRETKVSLCRKYFPNGAIFILKEQK